MSTVAFLSMGVSLVFPTIRESINRKNSSFSNSRKFSPAKDSRYIVLAHTHRHTNTHTHIQCMCDTTSTNEFCQSSDSVGHQRQEFPVKETQRLRFTVQLPRLQMTERKQVTKTHLTWKHTMFRHKGLHVSWTWRERTEWDWARPDYTCIRCSWRTWAASTDCLSAAPKAPWLRKVQLGCNRNQTSESQ